MRHEVRDASIEHREWTCFELTMLQIQYSTEALTQRNGVAHSASLCFQILIKVDERYIL